VKAVPAERLLVFNVREGWEPLPGIPFPHVNEREAMRAMIAGFITTRDSSAS
jgi:hypothetical protein